MGKEIRGGGGMKLDWIGIYTPLLNIELNICSLSQDDKNDERCKHRQKYENKWFNFVFQGLLDVTCKTVANMIKVEISVIKYDDIFLSV